MNANNEDEVVNGAKRRRTATKSMQIDANLVDALAALAERRRDQSTHDGRRGPRVTIRALVEEAVLDKCPELRSAAGVTNDPAAAGATGEEAEAAQAQVWSEILRAVYASATPQDQNIAIDALEGAVVGNFGERLRLRELAYHLRASEAPIGSMGELVESFEKFG